MQGVPHTIVHIPVFRAVPYPQRLQNQVLAQLVIHLNSPTNYIQLHPLYLCLTLCIYIMSHPVHLYHGTVTLPQSTAAKLQVVSYMRIER